MPLRVVHQVQVNGGAAVACPAEHRCSGGVPSGSPPSLDAKHHARADRRNLRTRTTADNRRPPTTTSRRRIPDSGHLLVVVLEHLAALLFALGVGGRPDRL